MPALSSLTTALRGRRALWGLLILAAVIVAAVLVWQGVTASGNPDPTLPRTSAGVAVLDIAVLVFREGLECILVLSAITASLMGGNRPYQRPIAVGAAAGAFATLITWFIAVGIVSDLTTNLPALDVQAATGLLAVVVLLVVMNWFFHKFYWTGWISLHNRKKRALIQDQKAEESQVTARRFLVGLGLLGFASLYREGFEVVLFLQSYRMQWGNGVILEGALLGIGFSGIVAILTFVAHRHLPYKKMLIVTGVLLTIVLMVMVGEQAQEMQLAGWISTTNIPALRWIPAWLGTWFSIFPTVETLAAQSVAVALVLGSYLLARYRSVLMPKRRGALRPASPPVSTVSTGTRPAPNAGH